MMYMGNRFTYFILIDIVTKCHFNLLNKVIFLPMFDNNKSKDNKLKNTINTRSFGRKRKIFQYKKFFR